MERPRSDRLRPGEPRHARESGRSLPPRRPPRPAPPIAVPGRTCWRREEARRLAVLVDGAAYFEALAAAMERAERSIAIVGWDVHSRTVLRPERAPREELLPLLRRLLEARPSLEVRILAWDYAVVYALEREAFPAWAVWRGVHPRLRFRLDGRHPVGASHHQKIVVIDDALAFAGGIDLTIHRWDTPEHRAVDPRRAEPGGALYEPFHDVQVAVDGACARALGDVVRERWARAEGEAVPQAPPGLDPWPPGLAADIERVPVAIARTVPSLGGEPAVREVEALFLEEIAAARRAIYLESQYMSSDAIAGALERRLAEPDGPEVVLVGPERCCGALEEASMGARRAQLLARLRAADRHGRLLVCSPRVAGPGGASVAVNLHSKVTIVDDAHLRVGSANLSGRSMGLDTECDLAVDAEGRDDVRRAIAGLRDRLVGEHVGASAEEVAAAVRAGGSLRGAIAGLQRGARSLAHLEGGPDAAWLEEIFPLGRIVDSGRPIVPGNVLEEIVPRDAVRSRGRPVLRFALLLLVPIALALAWQSPSLRALARLESLVDWAEPYRLHPLAPLAVTAVYVAAGLVMFPLMALIVATAAIFGPVLGFVYGLLGSLASALAGYGGGALLGRDVVQRWGGTRARRIAARVRRHGVAAVAAVRMVPVAPYTLVNLVAGAMGVPLRSYLAGTAIGLLPGLAGLSIFGDRLLAVLRRPSAGGVGALLAVVAALAAMGWWLRRRARRGRDGGPRA